MRKHTLNIGSHWLTTLIIVLGMLESAKAQTSFIVDDFLEEYYIKVTVEPETDESEIQTVRFHVFDKQSDKKLTTSSADWSSQYITQNFPKAEGTSVPYQEQSWFLYEDINFDGIKDVVLPQTYIVPFESIPSQGFVVFEGDGKGKYLYNGAFSTKIRSKYPAVLTVDSKLEKLILQQQDYQDLESYEAEYEVRENEPIFIKSKLQYQHQPYGHHTVAYFKSETGERKVEHYQEFNHDKKDTEEILKVALPAWKATARVATTQGIVYFMIEHHSGQIEEVYSQLYHTRTTDAETLYFGKNKSFLSETYNGEINLVWREADETLHVKADSQNKFGSLKKLLQMQENNLLTSYRIHPHESNYYAQVFVYNNSKNKDRSNMYCELRVFNQLTGQQLLKDIFISLDFNQLQLKPQTDEWEYDKQNVFRIADFNFDGKADVIVQNEKKEEVKVFLNQEEKLRYSPEFSEIFAENRHWELTTENGSPRVITCLNRKEENTWEKSQKTYALLDGLPLLLSRKGEFNNGSGYTTYITEHREQPNSEWLREEKQHLFFEDGALKELISFSVPKKSLRASFFQHQNRLVFAIHDKKGVIQEKLFGSIDSSDSFIVDYAPDHIALNFGLEGENSLALEDRLLSIQLHINGQNHTWEKRLKNREQKQLENLLDKEFENVQIRTHYLEIPNSNYYAFIQNLASCEEDVEEAARVLIIDRESEQTLLEQVLHMRQLPDDMLSVNEHEFPYGAHSLIMYEDFNFDGKKDLAILDGFHSCYRGPSYQVYLAAENSFEWNEGFSELAQFYCGMFKVNQETQTLETLAKSGCCWHEHSKFVVKNNQPYLIEQFVEDDREEQSDLIIGNTRHYKRIKGETEEIPLRKLNIEALTDESGAFNENKMHLYFEFEGGNKMFLFEHMENLFYVYTTADHKIIEFVTYHYNYPSAGKPYYQFTDEETHEYDEKELLDSTDYRIYWDRVEIRKNADKKVRRPIKRQVFPSASLNFTGIN